MNRFVGFSLLIVLLALSIHCGGAGERVSGECEDSMSDEEAISFAEDFIRVNGYTMHEPRRSKVTRGYMDDEPMDELLARRRGVLREHAVGYSKRGNEWIVAFEYTKERTIQGKPTGRSVVVGRCGKDLSMPHESVFPYEMDTALVF